MALSSAPMFLLCMACLDGRCRRRRTGQSRRAAWPVVEPSLDSRDPLRSALTTRATAGFAPDGNEYATGPSFERHRSNAGRPDSLRDATDAPPMTLDGAAGVLCCVCLAYPPPYLAEIVSQPGRQRIHS